MIGGDSVFKQVKDLGIPILEKQVWESLGDVTSGVTWGV
jgi:hypothetical protein